MIASRQLVIRPASRKVLEFALANPEIVALDSISDIASRCGSARTTVYRIGGLLGFDSFQGFRKLFQDYLIEMAQRAETFARNGRYGGTVAPV
jgi:DNA-binding MurR/RpiR family transcriptional regulator